MCDPEITYGLTLYSSETWAFKSLPCYMMVLVPGWLLCVSVLTCLGGTVISDPTEHCDGKSMKHQLLLWGFWVDGIAWSCLITTVHSKAFSSQSTRARAEIPKTRHCSAKGILCLEAPATLTKLKDWCWPPLCMEQLLLWRTADRPVLSQLELYPMSFLQRK